mgnify:FL=1
MKSKIRIYLPFLANEFKRNLAYKGSFYLFMICSLFGSFIAYYLWMAIYGNSPDGTLGGLTGNEMVIYIFMTYVTSNMVTVGIADEISDNVMEGSVAMMLIKPIDYRMSLLFKALGNVCYRFFAPGIFVWIGLEIYKVTVLGMPVTSVQNLILYVISCFFSILIHLLFDFCFGMIAFVTTYMFGMMMAKEALLGFLSGQLIPLSFFPVTLQRAFDFLPFSSMIYTPVMVYLGKYTGMELCFVLLRQVVWIILLYALGSFLWSKITRRLVVLGG